MPHQPNQPDRQQHPRNERPATQREPDARPDAAPHAKPNVADPPLSAAPRPNPELDGTPAADPVTDLLAADADRWLEGFDHDAAQQRFAQLRDRHRMLLRGGVVAFAGMLAAVALLPPLLARATGDPGLINGARIALPMLLITGVGMGAWWLLAHRRLAAALAKGPPALRAEGDRYEHDARRWDRFVIVSGLIAGPLIIVIAAVNTDRWPWWFILCIAMGGAFILADDARRVVRLISEKTRAKRDRAQGGAS